MQKLFNIKNLIALILLGIVFSDYIPKIDLTPKPDAAILNIDKPNENILSLVKPIASLVTDPNDRAKIGRAHV